MGTRKLEEFLPKKDTKKKKALYQMVRFDNRMDLVRFMHQRATALGVSKNAYFLALIQRDMEEQNEK